MPHAVSIYNKPALLDYIHGAHTHAGKILKLKADTTVAQSYRESIERNPSHFPLTYVYTDNSRSFLDWSTRNYTFNLFSPTTPSSETKKTKKEKEEDKAKSDATLVMWVGGLGALLATFVFAKTLKTHFERIETLVITKDILKQLEEIGNPTQGRGTEFTQLVNSYLKVIENEYTYSRNKAIAVGMALTGFLGMAAGGYLVVATLMTASKITVFISLLGGVGNYGWHWDNTAVKRECYKLVGYTHNGAETPGLIKKVEIKFQEYDDNMGLLSEHASAPPQKQQPVPAAHNLQQSSSEEFQAYVPVQEEDTSPGEEEEVSEGYVPLYPKLPAYNPAYIPEGALGET
jgi:hypothetical protein